MCKLVTVLKFMAWSVVLAAVFFVTNEQIYRVLPILSSYNVADTIDNIWCFYTFICAVATVWLSSALSVSMTEPDSKFTKFLAKHKAYRKLIESKQADLDFYLKTYMLFIVVETILCAAAGWYFIAMIETLRFMCMAHISTTLSIDCVGE